MQGITNKTLVRECRELGYDVNDKTDTAVLTAVIHTSITSVEHAVCMFHNLTDGKGDIKACQRFVETLYPTCTPRSAAHHTCRMRNPETYRPKHVPRFPLTGGRSRSANVAASSMSAEVLAALNGLKRIT